MHPIRERLCLQRREFFTGALGGISGAALLSLLGRSTAGAAPLTPQFPAKAKRCICIFLSGAASHLDLFQYKPRLNELDGQRPPDDLLQGKRFAFIDKSTAVLKGTPRKFSQYGESGMWFSDALPNLGKHADKICKIDTMYTTQFNHHPAQLLSLTGDSFGGHPTLGAWLNYGLGSENHDLPGYVVLNSAVQLSAGSDAWQSGFLPAIYQGVPFQPSGNPVLNLEPPAGYAPVERDGLDTLAQLNDLHRQQMLDPEIDARIANFELSFRMQMAAPGLVDLSQEPAELQERYGVNRPGTVDAGVTATRAPVNAPQNFARHCLLARRMVEAGVRFVNLFFGEWDSHSLIDTEIPWFGRVIDQPIAALIADLDARGLLEDTLVIVTTEFGRTPLGQGDGRDHHPDAYTTLLIGGGAKPGLTYGTTDDIGWSIADNPVHVSDFHATLLKLFGYDHLQLGYEHLGVMQRLTPLTRESKVIEALLAWVLPCERDRGLSPSRLAIESWEAKSRSQRD
jgi:hypothetical protein